MDQGIGVCKERGGKHEELQPQGFSNFTHFQNYNVATSVALTASAEGQGAGGSNEARKI